jgi:hypothetical protein
LLKRMLVSEVTPGLYRWFSSLMLALLSHTLRQWNVPSSAVLKPLKLIRGFLSQPL